MDMPLYQADIFVYQIETGQERIIPLSIIPLSGNYSSSLVFSPDARSLLFTIVDSKNSTWQMNTLDLASGATRVLLQGRDMTYVSLAWTPRGIFATRYPINAADAPSFGIYLIDATDGSVQAIRRDDQPLLNFAVSPDGNQLAVAQGIISLGIEDTSAISSSLVLLDLRSGEQKVLEPEQQGIFGSVAWSPDSSKLLYVHSKAQDMTYTITGSQSGEPLRLKSSLLPGNPYPWRYAWHNNTTLLLYNLAENRERLYGLPIGSADAQEILARDLPQNEINSQVIYVGR